MTRHMYETQDALNERRPLCATQTPRHAMYPEPACAQCASIGMHLKSDTIDELRATIAELEAELQRLRTADKPRL